MPSKEEIRVIDGTRVRGPNLIWEDFYGSWTIPESKYDFNDAITNFFSLGDSRFSENGNLNGFAME